MKHGKNPTRNQKMLIGKYRLNCENWLVVKETTDELTLVHRHTDMIKVIKKGYIND